MSFFSYFKRVQNFLYSRCSAWTHLIVFIVILVIASYLKFLSSYVGWQVPPLAAWEIAALVHVFLVAQKLMQFSGFEYASRKFNARIKSCVLNVIGIFILIKLTVIFFETKVVNSQGELIPLLEIQEDGKAFYVLIHGIAPYIPMMPLIFFFFVNYIALRHVKSQANKLGIKNTKQERYLVGLIRFIDAPVVLPFFVMLFYLKYVDTIFESAINENMAIGIIGCCLLIVSNLLTGVFDDHWSSIEGEVE